VGGRGGGVSEDGADAGEVPPSRLTVVGEVGNLGIVALASVSLVRGKRKKESREEKWEVRTFNSFNSSIAPLASSETKTWGPSTSSRPSKTSSSLTTLIFSRTRFSS
jgi:hypothetical protein